MITVSFLTSLAIKSVLLAAMTFALLRLARERTPAERSLIAHFGLLAILLLPAAALALPAWAPLPQAMSRVDTAFPDVMAGDIAGATGMPTEVLSAPATGPVAGLPAANNLIIWIYALPVVSMFAMMMLAILRLFALRRRAEVLVDGAWLSALAGAQRRMGYKHGTALLVSEELRSPISWGMLRPTILLDPRALSAVEDAEAIIAHELAHVARFDWAKLLIARFVCALFWFNPLVWLLARESHQLREEAADDTVLLTDIAGSDYAALLVNAARHDNNAVLIAAHGVAPTESSLRRRVVRALDIHARRDPTRSGWGALSLVTVFAVAAPLAAFTTAAAPEPADLAGVTSLAPAPESAPQLVDRPPEASPLVAAAPLSADDLVAMRAVGVEPADLERFRNANGEIDPDTAIAAKALAVDPDYISAMRSVFGTAALDDLIGARAVGVDAGYARAMRSLDPRADLDEVIGARAVGLTPAYAQEMRRYFHDATLDDLISMRATGVTAEYVRAMRNAGMEVASPDDAIEAQTVTAPRGRARDLLRTPAATTRVTRDGRTAIVGPGGSYASRRNPDGTVDTAFSPPHGDDQR